MFTRTRLALKGKDMKKICFMARRRLPRFFFRRRKLTENKVAASSPTTMPQVTRLKEMALCFSMEISKKSHTLATRAACSSSWEAAGTKVFFKP